MLGGLEITDEGAGGVLPHERTTPKASTDRLDLTRATRANLSPVWGLSLASGLTGLLAEPGEPLGAITEDGVEHIVERVTDPDRIAAIQRVLAADDVLIADGHHRYSISRTYRDDVRAAGRDATRPAEQTLAFVNELVADQLSVAAIHRLYADITCAGPDRRVGQVIHDDRARPPDGRNSGGDAARRLPGAGRRRRLAPIDPNPGRFDGVRSLDGAWLETALGEVLTVSYQHGLAAALAAVDAGRAAAAVLIRPVSVAEIERTAREGLLMPPKSTFFTPKLKTGFVIRSLENELSA